MKTKTENRTSLFLENSGYIKKGIRTVAIFVLLLSTANIASAQNKLGIKVMAGGSCQSELLKISDNSNLRFAYGIGITDNFSISETFALQTGMEYTQKGIHNDKNDSELKNTLHYLQVPVLAEFSAGEKAGFKNGKRVYFAAGPYFAYLLNSDSKTTGTANTLEYDFRNYDLGLRLNLGMEFPILTSNKLRVGLNYDMGFTEVYKNQTDMQNKMCSVSVGVVF